MDNTVLQQQLQQSFDGFLDTLQSFTDPEFQWLPDDGGWSPAMVADHITRSSRLLAESLAGPGEYTDRPPNAREEEIRSLFLDFGRKFDAPERIRPEGGNYDRKASTDALSASFNRLLDMFAAQDLAMQVNHPIFGPISKWELLYFAQVHTIRHRRQLENLMAACRQYTRLKSD